jgi:hypothetical protein
MLPPREFYSDYRWLMDLDSLEEAAPKHSSPLITPSEIEIELSTKVYPVDSFTVLQKEVLASDFD